MLLLAKYLSRIYCKIGNKENGQPMESNVEI